MGLGLSLTILLSAPLLSVIDVFIINVAIPSIRKGVHATDAETQLVIAGYLLGYAVFLITGGRAGDLFVWSFHHSDDALCGAFVPGCYGGLYGAPDHFLYTDTFPRCG